MSIRLPVVHTQYAVYCCTSLGHERSATGHARAQQAPPPLESCVGSFKHQNLPTPNTTLVSQVLCISLCVEPSQCGREGLKLVFWIMSLQRQSVTLSFLTAAEWFPSAC